MKMRCFVLMIVAILGAAFLSVGAHGCFVKPNFIVILADDQRANTIQYFPNILSEIAEKGVTFSNAFVTTPVCCPMRATMLRGVYYHHMNPFGAAPAVTFNTQGYDQSTIAVWLRNAGYTTGLFGKYMNGNDELAPTIPPGYDSWRTFVDHGYYNFSLNEDGAIVEYDPSQGTYSTDLLKNMLLAFIGANKNKPFFAIYAPFAPHSSGVSERLYYPVPAVRHNAAFANLPPYESPSFFESDMSDKPLWMEALPLATPEYVQAVRIEELESLLAVDEAVKEIVDLVESLNISNRTVIMYVSDNGLLWGEHNAIGKQLAYEESVRVPLIIRYPYMVHTAREESRLVASIDLAPTIMDLARLPLPAPVNGVSLKPLLLNEQIPWREDVLIEFPDAVFPIPPAWHGVRTEGWKYIYTDPYLGGLLPEFEELYDLTNDPHELSNLLVTDPENLDVQAKAGELKDRLIRLLAE